MGLVNARSIAHALWETTFAVAGMIQLVGAIQYLSTDGALYLWGERDLLIAQVVFQVASFAALATWETAFVERQANPVEDGWFFAWVFLFMLYNLIALIDTVNTLHGTEFPRNNMVLQLSAQLCSFVPLAVFRSIRMREGYAQITQGEPAPTA